jgi:hypothetical protein
MLSDEMERNKHFKLIGQIKNKMPRVKPILDNDYVVRANISPDGQNIAVAGSFNVYFINPLTLELVVSQSCPRAVYIKMTDGHVFVKHVVGAGDLSLEWTVISYMGTNLLTNLK